MSRTLDPLRFPLWGSRLIEASAGTGKTWTIAALYLRLVLGHGDEGGVDADADRDGSRGTRSDDADTDARTAYGRPLLPSEILVMTFTRAATRELSDRIRSRLVEAARCFRGEAAPDAGDPLLAGLLAAHPPGPARTAAAWRLAMAAEGMDDAAVHTIDAWCQRMLREHAFDSGCLFDEELVADPRTLLVQACRDYWRQHLYRLPAESLDRALDVWKTVDALTGDVADLLRHALPEGAGEGSLAEVAERVSAERAAALARLKAGWSQRARDMQAWLEANLAGKNPPLLKAKLKAGTYPGWLARLGAWADDPDMERPALTDTARERLVPAGIREAMRADAALQLPDDFEAFERLLADLGRLPAVGPAMRLHAAACVAARLAVLKRQAGAFGFDDMLARLDAALQGGDGERLRAGILARYPVALVDEYQDTSPVQARIFEALYRTADNDRSTALLLIGDPKQSIYGFRGADIHSYLRTRRATAGRHYVLSTNHRSTAPLVGAVNHFFARAERLNPRGAFMFRSAGDGGSAAEAAAGTATATATATIGREAAVDNPLPFTPVHARGRSERLVTSAGPHPAVVVQHETETRNMETSRRHFAARCAEAIAALLADERAGFDDAQAGAFTPLRPADIAVLVRTGNEAAAVRKQLRLRGVASVYLSEKNSVFDSGEARDLLHWLAAVAAPLDTALVRTALATATVGLSMDELAVLAADDEAFDARSDDFRRLLRVWQSQGVLTMLRQTLHLLALPARWLGSEVADGERRLTNFLHLAELLQAASARLEGEQALIRWLAGQLDGSLEADDERIVRLESDAGLVKVITIHKSKGLEYPLVFLPFACHFRAVDRKRTQAVSLADDEGRRHLHLDLSDDALIAGADRERLQEDLRLLYVALTRARHAVWVGFAALTVGNAKACAAHRSAIGFALLGGDEVPAAGLQGHLQDLADGCADIALAAAGDPALRTRIKAAADDGAGLHDWPPYQADFERRWTVGSYSSLVRSLAAPAVRSHLVLRDDEMQDDGAQAASRSSGPADRTAAGAGAGADVATATTGTAASASATADAPWHTFPRGALAGNFLHGELEWLAGEDFALDDPAVAQQLLRRCERQGWGHRGEAVLGWLQAVAATVLPPLGASLAALATQRPEMEFWLPSDGFASRSVDALCRRHLLGGRERPALPDRELRGMLTGFADLVFEHGGRYWVLDYKSNRLGPHDDDYRPEALEAAMAAHRYDVQAGLYLLALHRLLRLRLGDAYEPEAQLGGAVFLFLRGIRGPANGCCLVPAATGLLDALDALLPLGSEAAAP